jgi:hypothetical protein
MKQNHSIAVIGAGITGSVAALALADKGHRVCLFDKATAPLRGASLINEGKIHIGFVYVNDPSSRSLDVMIDSAVVFRSVLERWINPTDFDALVTEPFGYIVPTDTQLSPGSIELKFRLIKEKIKAAEARYNTRYLGMPRTHIWSRSSEIPDCFNSKKIIAHYQTLERSVDTNEVARHLNIALEEQDQIELHMCTPVLNVLNHNNTWRLHAGLDHRHKEFGPFDFIINASWEGRLNLDEQVFGPSDGNWFHRYKTAVILTPENMDNIPNFTAIIGPYGDVVRYPSGRTYLSWYPAGMLSSSSNISGVKTEFSDAVKLQVALNSIAGLSQFVPKADTVFSQCQPEAKNVEGGIIMARGRTDIDDAMSELHQRYRIGIKQQGGYFSIDTGKYTCGPALAMETVNRILT